MRDRARCSCWPGPGRYRDGHGRMMPGLFRAVVVVLALAGLLAPGTARAQIDPNVQDRVLPAAVQIGLLLTATEDGVSSEGH
jgi:hypothetical protein